MTANLFFSQTIPKTPASSIGRGRTGVTAKQRSSVTEVSNNSLRDDHKSFLNTLKKISNDKNPTKQRSGISREDLSEKPVRDSANNFKMKSNSSTGPEIENPATTMEAEKEPDNMDFKEAPELDFLSIVNALEEIGLYDFSGGSSPLNGADGALDDPTGLAALKMAVANVGQSDLALSDEIKSGLESLRQLIAAAQAGMSSSHGGEISFNDISRSQTEVSINLDQIMSGTISDEGGRKGDTGVINVAAENFNEKPADALANISRILAELNKNSGETGSIQSSENLGKSSQSQNTNQTATTQLTARTLDGLNTIGNLKGATSLEKVGSESPELEKGLGSSDPIKSAARAGLINQISSTNNPVNRFGDETANEKSPNDISLPASKLTESVPSLKTSNTVSPFTGEAAPKIMAHNESDAASRLTDPSQAVKALNAGMRITNEAAQENIANTESSPVSKMINDARIASENNVKMDAPLIDESGLKVAKIDAGANETGMQGSPGQTAEKASEASASSKQTEAGPDNLRTQTLDQIVKKAVIHLRNGQHEAKIDLKPNFLGHVRMQVTTENHFVTVKILTEFPMVKEMVENNIHQLKADLQQQGLNIDKLEVSVSNDSDKYEDARRETGRAKNRQRNAEHKNPDNPEKDDREPTGKSGSGTAGESAIDYFA